MSCRGMQRRMQHVLKLFVMLVRGVFVLVVGVEAAAEDNGRQPLFCALCCVHLQREPLRHEASHR